MDDASTTNTDAITLTSAETRATKEIVRTHQVSLICNQNVKQELHNDTCMIMAALFSVQFNDISTPLTLSQDVPPPVDQPPNQHYTEPVSILYYYYAKAVRAVCFSQHYNLLFFFILMLLVYM